MTGTFDTPSAKEVSLKKIMGLFSSHGCERVYIKQLAPNDNSKNQIYFGGHLSDVAFLPSGDPVGFKSDSAKDKKRSIRYQLGINVSWFDVDGRVYKVPDAKLIYYPQYPEVRFSGFLQGSGVQAGEWMDPKKSGRSLDRWLLMAVGPDKSVYTYLAVPDSALSLELASKYSAESSLFTQLDQAKTKTALSTRDQLLLKIRAIHEMGWVESSKLDKDSNSQPYKGAQNAGGYTLESLLGVKPNGDAKPDYLGWEVKSFSVKGLFPTKGVTVTTLFTPEPDGGVYSNIGFKEFMSRYGYPDRSGKPDRINFGGTHYHGVKHSRTNLTLTVTGFDSKTGSISDPNGAIALVDENGEHGASWSFSKMMSHWKRKHAQAVYIPCLKKREEKGIYFHYGSEVELGAGTSFEILLNSIVSSGVYYDPGLKIENFSTPKPTLKRRNQFRVKHAGLGSLYNSFEYIDAQHSP